MPIWYDPSVTNKAPAFSEFTTRTIGLEFENRKMNHTAKALPGGTRIHHVMFGGLGGHASVVRSLVVGSPELAHSVSFYGTQEPLPELVQFFVQHDVPWRAVLKRRGPDPLALLAQARAIHSARPDAVVMHSATVLPAALAARAVWRVPFMAVDHTCHAAKQTRERLSLVGALRTADLTVFLTPQAHAAAQKRLGRVMLGRPICVIPNGIDTEVFSPRVRATSSNNSVLISMVSRFSAVRDHGTLLSAVELLFQRRPELRGRMKVVLAGDGETHAHIVAQSRERCMTDVVSFVGTLDEARVVELLQATTVYVQSSLADTMSTSVMQAMATGNPCIATDIDGMDFLIRHGETGLLVPAKDSQALSLSLEHLVTDEGLRARLGAAARKEAERRFSAKVMARRYSEALAGIVTAKRCGV